MLEKTTTWSFQLMLQWLFLLNCTLVHCQPSSVSTVKQSTNVTAISKASIQAPLIKKLGIPILTKVEPPQIISLVTPTKNLGKIPHDMWLTFLAAASLYNGRIKEGFDYIEEALSIIQQSKEVNFLSYLHQLQGSLFVLDKKPEAAEQAYHQAIAITQAQSAKWFELLAAKGLARLWHSQGKTAEAYALLHGVYSWFTEGFEMVEMVEAKALLEEWEPSSMG